MEKILQEIEDELEEELSKDDSIEVEEEEEDDEPFACSRCEDKVREEVCGANGKTYNSLCHAVNCGGLKEGDITAGPCKNKV